MEIFIGIIVGLLMLMLLVTGHEFGHFIMARRNGVEVEEFGICFPPRAIAWRKVEGKWTRIPKKDWDKMPGEGLIISLNWLPIGGFCQMKGESASDKRKGTFGKASFKSKTKILFGGVAVNWLIAIVVLTVLAWVGMPQFMENQFNIESDSHLVVKVPVTLGEVKEGSPAADAQLQTGDIIRTARAVKDDGEIETSDIVVSQDLIAFNDANAGKTVYYGVEGQNGLNTYEVKLNDEGSEYILGAVLQSSTSIRNTWSAPIVGVGTTLQITGETFKGVGQLIYDLFAGVILQVNPDEATRNAGKEALNEAGNSVSGPVGIIGVLFPSFMKMGFDSLMFLVALISISLACMNVLPIPALDGGRWFLIALYKLRKKELTKEKEEKIVGRAFTAILVFALIVTIIDIMRIL